jgi:hypothetical protein
MNYFSAEALRNRADSFLIRNFSAANVVTALNALTKTASDKKVPPVPADPADKPAIIFDIFLSHSSLDEPLILGIHDDLTRRGYSVYLDRFCDPQLDRTNVTPATARTLRYRIAQSRSLFVATTSNTTSSKWVPWELGFSDGWNGKAAILPLLEKGQTTFKGQEYFGLYPEVRDGEKTPSHNFTKPFDLWIYANGSYDSAWGPWIDKPRKL